MRQVVEVRISVARPAVEVWKLACDGDAWPAMPGARVVLELAPSEQMSRLEYRIRSGLPVLDHHGVLALLPTPTGGTELVFTESFRPRIWGTGGYLRGRRERVLIDTVGRWGHERPEGD